MLHNLTSALTDAAQYANTPLPRLSVALGPVVGDAQHLAVIGGTAAALAPCGDMVRVHLGHRSNLALAGIMADGAERTIGYAAGFRNLGLFSEVAETQRP